MLENFKYLTEIIAPILKLGSVLFLGYAILMGFAHRKGKITWLDREKERRKSQGMPTINLLSKGPKADLPWKDPSLIQGGLTAIFVIVILLGYVVLMLLWEMLESGKPLGKYMFDYVSVLMAFPITMVGFFIALFVWLQRSKGAVKHLWGLIVISFVGSISSWIVQWLVESEGVRFMLQLGVLGVLSFFLSYVIGISQALKEADLEARFPLVKVITVQGDTINRLRFYEKTDTDYRFIGEDGIDHIIPIANILEVQHHSIDREGSTKDSTERLSSE